MTGHGHLEYSRCYTLDVHGRVIVVAIYRLNGHVLGHNAITVCLLLVVRRYRRRRCTVESGRSVVSTHMASKSKV